jgi:hypothetical protein
LLHTILFNRALGQPVTPKDVECEVFENLTYVRVDDASIVKMVESNVEQFMQSIEKSGESKGTVRYRLHFAVECLADAIVTVPPQVGLAFFAKTVKKAWGGLTTKEEKVFWERWTIAISISKEKTKTQTERDRKQAARLQALRDRLLYAVQMINEKKEHIPPVSKSAACFPFEVILFSGVVLLIQPFSAFPRSLSTAATTATHRGALRRSRACSSKGRRC